MNKALVNSKVMSTKANVSVLYAVRRRVKLNAVRRPVTSD